MKIVVVGSGLIGVTTAYFLQRGGHQVTVIDRQMGPGRETSFANGALLTPSMSDPWNAPGCWRVLLASLTRSDAALQLRLRALPNLVSWGAMFLRNSTAAAFKNNTMRNLDLALYSSRVMKSLLQQVPIDYGRAARGSLRVFRDRAALDRTAADADRMLCDGLSFRKLTRDATIELEPALTPIANQLNGAIHYETDEVGDAHRFCEGLTTHAQQLGVEFRFHTEVSSLQKGAGAISAVVAGRERFVADRYVVAAGSYSTDLLRRIGIALPVQPAKGYSITFERSPAAALRIPVVDDQFHAAVVPLDRAIRVAGTAEFSGYDLAMRPGRIRNLLKLLDQLLPEAHFDPAKAKPWCGLRPMCADGVPIIGTTPLSNLLVNTGHGHLGWTMAAGSAQLIADLLSAGSPAIDPAPYALARFRH